MDPRHFLGPTNVSTDAIRRSISLGMCWAHIFVLDLLGSLLDDFMAEHARLRRARPRPERRDVGHIDLFGVV